MGKTFRRKIRDCSASRSPATLCRMRNSRRTGQSRSLGCEVCEIGWLRAEHRSTPESSDRNMKSRNMKGKKDDGKKNKTQLFLFIFFSPIFFSPPGPSFCPIFSVKSGVMATPEDQARRPPPVGSPSGVNAAYSAAKRRGGPGAGVGLQHARQGRRQRICAARRDARPAPKPDRRAGVELLLQHERKLQDGLSGQERQDGAAVRAVEDRQVALRGRATHIQLTGLKLKRRRGMSRRELRRDAVDVDDRRAAGLRLKGQQLRQGGKVLQVGKDVCAVSAGPRRPLSALRQPRTAIANLPSTSGRGAGGEA